MKHWTPSEIAEIARQTRAGQRVERTGLIETNVDQGPIGGGFGSAPFEVLGISWSSADGEPVPVRITFNTPYSKTGPGVTVPRSSNFTGGFAAAVIEYSVGGTANVVIVDWPATGRSVVLMASRINVRLRTQLPAFVTAAGQALFPLQLSDSGPVASRDFAPMTYTELQDITVPGPGTIQLFPPQGAVAVMASPQTPGVQMMIACLDEIGATTLLRRTAATSGAATSTEVPESPTPIPAGCQRVAFSSTGLTAYVIHPVWLIDP